MLNTDDVVMTGNTLQWNDVFLLCHLEPTSQDSIVLGLRSQGIPVNVLSSESTQEEIERVAVGRENQVTVACWQRVHGLERRVVIGMRGFHRDRLVIMSRCTGQLIWIDVAGLD